MLRLAFLILFVFAAVGLSYLPYSKQGTTLIAQKSSLQIEMTQISGLLLDRQETDRKFSFHSKHLIYDEAQDSSILEPYHFVGSSAGNFFDGNSQQAKLQGNLFELNQQVVLKQATTSGEIRTLNTEKLIMDIQQHSLNSPNSLRITDSKQTIQADSLVGNYEEGNYEFTHHVQSHWQ
jgi:LPS export ABC transporter protein LptC